MKVVLRVIAVWLSVNAIGPASILLLAGTGGLRIDTLRSGLVIGVVILWLAACLAAARYLWRLRELGRRLAIVACVLPILFVAVQFGSLEVLLHVTPFQAAKLLVLGFALVTLLTPAARRACATSGDASAAAGSSTAGV